MSIALRVLVTRHRTARERERVMEEGVANSAAAIRAALCAPRDATATMQDVRAMRGLMRREFGPKTMWELKHATGGLVDVEFIAQALQILSAQAHPEVLDTNTGQALGRLAAAGLLPEAEAGRLSAANALYHRLTQVLRLCVSGAYDPAAAPSGLNRLVAGAAGLPDIAATEALLADTQAEVAGIFSARIGPVME